MTMNELCEILIECAGADEATLERGDIAEMEFEDLGYDSLALLETAARIKQRFGVSIPDERIVELGTPGSVLDAVNAALAAR
ncbi:MAG TPA: acyl carrier protein [Pseudonocardiaceae bacterium]|jgi:act minimal PKS acyl carrier protein